MACDNPFRALKAGESRYTYDIMVPCGKCPPCKLRKVREWVFRLRMEEKRSTSAFFLTLTYENPPMSENGFMTLSKRDIQLWFKKLRKLNKQPLKYYLVGEYGGKTLRPHYHLILFNLEDIEYIYQTWEHGFIHQGQVEQASIAYTLKYMDKQTKIPIHNRDDRVPEFSLKSKGLGDNYITDYAKKYHSDLERNSLHEDDGTITAMPRYYRMKLLTEQQRRQQTKIIQQKVNDDLQKQKDEFQKMGMSITFENYLTQQKAFRVQRHKSNIAKRNKI